MIFCLSAKANHGTMCYDVLVMDNELKEALEKKKQELNRVPVFIVLR